MAIFWLRIIVLLLIQAVIPGLFHCTGLIIHGEDVEEGGVLPLHLLDAEPLDVMVAGFLVG